MYYDMGFLETAEVVEVSATDLVGEYVGQTGPKTQRQLEKALGKVLFIDEAYRLADGHFAKEAMDEIVDCLTKPAFAQKLLVILAGYDADVNRLMSINPGLTSRFPDTVTFQSMDSMQCLSLLTKQLEKKKHLDIRVLDFPSPNFRRDILDCFSKLIGSSNWGNARDVSQLTKSIYGTALKAANPNSTDSILLDENAVLLALDSMIKERTYRGGAVRSTVFSDLPMQSADPQTPLLNFLTQAQAKCDTPTGETEPDRSPAIGGLEESFISDPVKPDSGVSKETWAQLKLDMQIAATTERRVIDLEAEITRTQREADVNEKETCEQHPMHGEELQSLVLEQDEARHRFEQERLQRELNRRKHLEKLAQLEREKKTFEEARKKEQAAQRKLRSMGLCVAGFRWIKQTGGYRCAGGSHFVSDAQLS